MSGTFFLNAACKNCNIKHNSESVFRYFASTVNSKSAKCDRKDLYAICSYWSFQKVGYVPRYTFRKSLFGIQRLGFISPCIAYQPDQTGFTLCRFTWSGFGIHLITAVSVIKRLSLYEFTLWGRDLVSVVRITESPYYSDFFLKKIYENFFATLETVRNRVVSVPRGSAV